MPEDTLPTSTMADASAAQPAAQAIPLDQLSSMVNTLLASPEFQKSARFDDFLVSPSLSPCDDLNMSPIDDSPFSPNLDTPIMNDLSDDFGMFSEYSGVPLFDDGAMTMYQLLESPEVAQEAFSQMYELPKSAPAPAPSLDAVNPTSLALPAAAPPASAPAPKAGKAAAASRRKSTATGTRKNITPDSLVPVDAPIQGRNYATPSATSRKELPAAFLKSQKRKRSRTQAFGDEDSKAGSPPVDADAEEQPPLNATEKEIIEWKRRQNTLAARKSRKRKLEHQQFLETRVKDLETENEMLKVKTDALEAALRAHNIFLPATNA